jgi:hypothetical protein
MQKSPGTISPPPPTSGKRLFYAQVDQVCYIWIQQMSSNYQITRDKTTNNISQQYMMITKHIKDKITRNNNNK